MGYCEYYAGTFAILSRLAGIPSRLVSGYYGGNYNSVGDFYTFKQQDAHSWVEVYLNGKWILFDPTIVIPNQNIINSNNFNLINNESTTLSIEENEIFNKKNIKIYFNYINYIWTNNFINYDDQSRKEFIENKLRNKNLINYGYVFIVSLILAVIFIKVLKIIFTRKIYFNLFLKKLVTSKIYKT